VTVDNCSINDATIRILLEKLQGSSLILGGSLLHMLILNLVVQDCLVIIGDGIEIFFFFFFLTASPKRIFIFF
jgi:hypothetical protein